MQAELTWELVKWFQQKEGTPDELMIKFAESYCTILRALGVDRQNQMLQEAADDANVDIQRWINTSTFQEQVEAKYKQLQSDISPEAGIIMQSIDPALRNAWEEEIVNPSPWRGQRDGDGEPPIFA